MSGVVPAPTGTPGRSLVVLRALADLPGHVGDSDEVEVVVVSDTGTIDAAHPPYDRVLVVGSGDSPADLRALVDLAAPAGPGDVLVTAVSVADADADSWAAAFAGLEVAGVDDAVRAAVLRHADDPAATAGPFLHGWTASLAVAAPEAPVATAPAPAPVAAPAPPTKKAAPVGRRQRLQAALLARRKLLVVAGVLALVAFAISLGLVALLDEYWLAVLGTGLAMLVAVGILRSEQQSRRLLARDRERHAQLTALTKSLGPSQMESLRRAVSANEMATHEVIKRLRLMREGFSDANKAGLLRHVTRDARGTFEQVQATINLFALVDVRAPVPPMRGWAVSPDALNILVGELIAGRPRLVVECGSGVSTLFLGLVAQKLGIDTRIVALDHDAEFAARTNRMLALHGVDDIASARVAPLSPVATDEGEKPWYDTAALDGLDGIGLLFVDGPPASSGPLARYPALPQLWERLTPDASIVLDDTVRDDEQAIIERWTTAHPELTTEVFATEKGTHVLRRGA